MANNAGVLYNSNVNDMVSLSAPVAGHHRCIQLLSSVLTLHVPHCVAKVVLQSNINTSPTSTSRMILTPLPVLDRAAAAVAAGRPRLREALVAGSGLKPGEPLDCPPVPWMHGAAGIASGAIGMTLFYPLDFLRTRMHTYDGGRRLEGLASICRAEGLRGMYRGVGVAVGSHSLGWGLYLTLFRVAQNQTEAIAGKRTGPGDFVAACFAATATATAVTPLNLLKVRAQLARGAAGGGAAAVTAGRARPGVFASLRAIARAEGPAALFHGLGPQIALSAHTTIQVALYEGIKRAIWGDNNPDMPVAGIVATAAVSKAAASAISNPLEVVRTRTQDARSSGGAEYRNMRAAFQTLWRTEGLRGMYRGVGVNVCRVIPTTVVAFALYESILKLFYKRNHSNPSEKK